jgi:hypothetical protein
MLENSEAIGQIGKEYKLATTVATKFFKLTEEEVKKLPTEYFEQISASL